MPWQKNIFQFRCSALVMQFIQTWNEGYQSLRLLPAPSKVKIENWQYWFEDENQMLKMDDEITTKLLQNILRQTGRLWVFTIFIYFFLARPYYWYIVLQNAQIRLIILVSEWCPKKIKFVRSQRFFRYSFVDVCVCVYVHVYVCVYMCALECAASVCFTVFGERDGKVKDFSLFPSMVFASSSDVSLLLLHNRNINWHEYKLRVVRTLIEYYILCEMLCRHLCFDYKQPIYRWTNKVIQYWSF